MKYYALLLICFVTSLAYSQTVSNDTMYLKDGTMYVGKFLGDVYKNYEFTPIGSKKIVTIPKESVLSITNHSKQWTTTVDDATDLKTKAIEEDNYLRVTRFDTLSFASLRLEVKKMKIQSMVAGQDLQTAGKCGIAGGVLSLGGTILSVVGAVTGEPALTYVGAGVGGTGMILNFVAFGKLIKAGRRTR
jgi:hypothetical protein